jgi:micrococcal nuclease
MPTTKSKSTFNKLKKDLSPTHKPKVVEPYQYWAQVQRVVDGDTIELNVELGFKVTVKERFRLIGVDTPEVYGVKRTSEEYKRGKAASDFVKSLIPPGSWVEIRVYAEKREKYGRWLCEVFVGGKSLNETLVKKGFAMEYPK